MTTEKSTDVEQTVETEPMRVLDECRAIMARKANDYQNPNSTVVQADYYPNGVSTIQDVIWAKCLRAKSLLESETEVKNESLEDTYLDMINYASFAVAWLRGGIPGQRHDRDHKNRPKRVPEPDRSSWVDARSVSRR